MGEDKAVALPEVEAQKLLASLAAQDAEVVEAPAAFLIGVSATLKAPDDVDADLAAILTDHVLTVTPHANAVANAKAAITALAAKRAAAEEQADG